MVFNPVKRMGFQSVIAFVGLCMPSADQVGCAIPFSLAPLDYNLTNY